VARLRGELLDAEQTEAVLRIFELAHSQPDHVSARDRVAQAMAVFPTYYRVLENLFADTLARQRAL
jgi:hypothetical protein